MSKEWSGSWCNPGSCCEEWSVHAQLTLNPQQASNITVTTEGGTRGDSGYGSEKGACTPTARATCSVTLAGHHNTVTLTCSDIPVPPIPPQPKEKWVFCNHHDKLRSAAHAPTTSSVFAPTPAPPAAPPAPAPLAYKDAASQTSSSHIPQIFTPPQPPPPSDNGRQLEAKQKAKGPRRSSARVKKYIRSNHSSNNDRQNKSTASSSDGKKTPRTVHIDVYCTGSESSDSSSSDEETTSTPQTVFESDQMRVVHAKASNDTLPHALQRQKRCVLSNQSVPSVTSSISSGYPSAMSSLVSGTDGISLTSGSFLSSAVATSAKDTDFSSRDSFDYDNSFDKLRIREKERMWASHQRTQGTMMEESTDSSSDSEEGFAWSFDRALLKREDTVKRPPESIRKSSSAKVELCKSGSLSDSEASSLKYKRESINKPCEHVFYNLNQAKKFGPVVSSLKKPGHHVGPSKNPNCSCDTCRYFFEHVCCRNRTRSLGDHPI